MEYAARITGTGSAFPKRVVTNSDIGAILAEKNIQTSDKWIRERTGIMQRCYSDLNDLSERNSSLGYKASLKALEMAGKRPEDIDQIIYATCTPDTLIPSTACWLQHKLRASRAWAMDLNAACSGFVYALSIVEQFIRSGKTKTALIIGAEVLSPFINFEDRSSCILFGDGAGVAVVERVTADTSRRILSSHLLSDGSLWELLHIPAGGSNLEVTPDRYADNLHKIQMNGREIFKVAVRTLTEFARTALENNHLTISDIDWFIPHQANRRIIEAVANRLDLSMDNVLLNVDKYGNTSAATIPTVLDAALREGLIQEGQLLLLDCFGAGLTYGSILMRW